MYMEKANERVDGIFDKWDVPDDYARISEERAIATMKEIKIKIKNIRSTAIHTNHTENHAGLEITLINDRGEGVVFIPQTEFPDLSEIAKMKNCSVEYESRTWSSRTEGTSVKSKVRFIDGELAGNIYKGKEFA